MGSIVKPRPKGCHRIIETDVEGRIRRVAYEADAPAYGLLLIEEALKREELTQREADDLAEGIHDVAACDCTLDLLPDNCHRPEPRPEPETNPSIFRAIIRFFRGQ